MTIFDQQDIIIQEVTIFLNICFNNRINEAEFIEYGDVENHDDFYTVDEGRVHVQDQRGYYIMYDSAVDDFK